MPTVAKKRKKTPTPSSLPDDIVAEILSWAPVKTACRFLCVSRGWRALISDPAFVVAHKARVDPQLLLVANAFHGAASVGLRDLLLLDTDDGSVVRAVQAAGDLWTVTSGPHGPVCATRDDRGLNVIDLVTGDVLMASTEMGGDGAPYAFGIGYAAQSGVCKVVRLVGRDGPHTCEVLSSEDDERRWRQIRSPPVIDDYVRYYQGSMVTIDGVIYFLHSLEEVDKGRVLCLDLVSEQWKGSIKTPVRLREMRSSTTRMVELNGTLCMAQSEEGRETKDACTTIWLLSDWAKGTWVEAYVIPMPQPVDLVIPLKVMHHGGKLMYYCFHNEKANPTLQVYDPLGGTSTHLADLPYV